MGDFSRKSVADHNVLPGTWSLKCKRKPDCTIRKFKARYCVRGDIQKILSPKPQTQSHDSETPTYKEALSGKNLEEYFKAMYDEIQSLMRRETLDIFSRKSLADNNVLPGTWYFKCKRKPDWKIRKFNITKAIVSSLAAGRPITT